jgi:hypothetical protein
MQQPGRRCKFLSIILANLRRRIAVPALLDPQLERPDGFLDPNAYRRWACDDRCDLLGRVVVPSPRSICRIPAHGMFGCPISLLWTLTHHPLRLASGYRRRHPFIHPRACRLCHRASPSEERGIPSWIRRCAVAAHVGYDLVGDGVAVFGAGVVEAEEECS